MPPAPQPSGRPVASARLAYQAASSRSGPCFRRPIAATIRRMIALPKTCAVAGQTHVALGALALARTPFRPARRPHLLDIVEGPHLRPKNVNDNVARVDQHPVAMRNAFHPRGDASLAQILDNPIGNRPDMTVRPAGRNHHVVADRRLGS